MVGGASSPADASGHRLLTRPLAPHPPAADAHHRSMRTEPDPPDEAMPPAAAADAAGNAEAAPPASPEQIYPEQIYKEAMARHAVITDQWQQARDALLGADGPSTMTRRGAVRTTPAASVSRRR
jgi:hypothetical protein